MAITSEQVAHSELVGGGTTVLHLHSGGGSVNYKSGTTTTNSGGTGTVTFNTALADTNYAVLATPRDPADAITVTYGNKATTGFNVYTYEDKGQSFGNVVVDWMVIGYSNP